MADPVPDRTDAGSAAKHRVEFATPGVPFTTFTHTMQDWHGDLASTGVKQPQIAI